MLIIYAIKTEKIIPTAIEFVDIAGLVKGASKGEGLGNKFLANIRECDAIVQVVRFFEDSNIVHVHGDIDPKRDREVIDMDKFENLGVIKNEPEFNGDKLNQFENAINQLKSSLLWTKQQIVDQFFIMIPGFGYKDKGKYLDSKM